MFRTATAAKRVLSRRASLVESSEQLKIEAAILSELRKGLYSVNEAVLAKDESDRASLRIELDRHGRQLDRGVVLHPTTPIHSDGRFEARLESRTSWR